MTNFNAFSNKLILLFNLNRKKFMPVKLWFEPKEILILRPNRLKKG